LMPNICGLLRKPELSNHDSKDKKIFASIGLNNLDMMHHPDVHIKGKF
jgi:hypothetical protein